MTEEIKEKLSKVYELVRSGAGGEKKAAQSALDRLMRRYDFDIKDLHNINKKEYGFTYSSKLDWGLLLHLVTKFVRDHEEVLKEAYRTSFDEKQLKRCKQIRLALEYPDWVALDCAYEYYRRHMKAQWDKSCRPLIAKCRKPKTRKAKREQLHTPFLTKYLLESNLLSMSDDGMERKPIRSQDDLNTYRALEGIEGGSYHTQIQTAHMLTEPAKYGEDNQQLRIF